MQSEDLEKFKDRTFRSSKEEFQEKLTVLAKPFDDDFKEKFYIYLTLFT